MRSSFPKATVLLTLVALAGPGCAFSDLKNTNRRLKEANDRLVAENNRLEQELAASEKEVAEKSKLLAEIQSDKPRALEEPVAASKNTQSYNNLGFPDEPGIVQKVTPQGILLRLDDRVFFPQGRATISPQGKAILGRVAGTLNSRYRGKLIRVEGHTDDVPVKRVKNQYPSNWELSTARACTVVRYLVDNGNLSPSRVYPAGFAYYKPLSTARTEAARRQNRRVEILILNDPT